MSETIISKYGIYSAAEKPEMEDDNAADGLLMYGCRKVREKGGVGYIHAHKMKFGCKELAEHKGKWVLVDVSDYWAVTARVGFTLGPEMGYQFTGIKCDVLREEHNQ